MDTTPEKERHCEHGHRPDQIATFLASTECEKIARGHLINDDLAAETALDANNLFGLSVDPLRDGLELLKDVG